MPLFQTPPSSICILRLSAIGDCCHALALVRVIQRAWPETRITWVTGKIEATLFADLPGVEVIPFDKSKGWRGYRDLWRTLKGRKFDALLHLQAALRASIATLGIRVPCTSTSLPRLSVARRWSVWSTSTVPSLT